MIELRVILACLCLVVSACTTDPPEPAKVSKQQRIEGALVEEFRRTYDPALGYVPAERLLEAVEATRQEVRKFARRRSANDFELKFTSRGPNNIGGRTRAILIDAGDPERNRILAGSVAGGLFVTEDISASDPEWQVVDDALQNLAVGALAQDPNNPELMYMGTGEGFINFDAVRGVGIFKSIDSGVTWELLPATENFSFRFTRSMFVDPRTSFVYAATRHSGLMRSEDFGETWRPVLATSLGAQSSNMYDIDFSQDALFVSNDDHIYRSESGDVGSWSEVTLADSGFPQNLGRIEFAVCPSDNRVMFMVGEESSAATDIYTTSDGGSVWRSMGQPENRDFTNGQAWYDLDIAVDPFNCTQVVVGGVPIFQHSSNSFSFEWPRIANNMHVDQHKILFDPERNGVVYFGNDGGVWRSTTGPSLVVEDKNQGYITAQYYGCAIHPDTFSNYFLGGTQDNGTHSFNSEGIGAGLTVWGGDGFLCHIDENEPRFQMVSSQFGNWGLSVNGGQSFDGGVSVNGNFLNPSDYDSETGLLYTQTDNSGVNFARWNIHNGVVDDMRWTGVTGQSISTIFVDPTISNRVYFGSFEGSVFRIDNANQDGIMRADELLNTIGTISSIEVSAQSSADIIVTLSNYGIDNSVMVSSDDGVTWENVEGNLPDMPVRWGMFNPLDPNEALIATETGVWYTTNLNDVATEWIPPEANGTPIVRTDMLQWRSSDLTILAATHGRGLWTSNSYSSPRAKFNAPRVHYVDSPLEFIGSVSQNASSYVWDFGNGQTSTLADPVVIYDELGDYNVSLTINDELTTTSPLRILPAMAVPYSAADPAYGGDFEAFDEQFGVESISGSTFSKGNSVQRGKDGTSSGANAYVLGIDEPVYQPNTQANLYTPLYDLSAPGIYTFKFSAKYELHPGPDGFMIEYTPDLGQSWEALGSPRSGWYNFSNTGVANSAFPEVTAYFTGSSPNFQQFTQNISFLAGSGEVAFRFVFRSEATGFHPGVALDDIEVTAFEGELATAVFNFAADRSFDRLIDISWSTMPEYYCRRFELERSLNGRDFTGLATIPCEGVISDVTRNYEYQDNGGRDLYFYRLKVISHNADSTVFDEFHTPIIAISRDLDPNQVFRAFPNPFRESIGLTFNRQITGDITVQLFNASGQLVVDRIESVDGVFTTFEVPQVPAGVYYLRVQIADAEEQIVRLMGGF